MNGSDDNIELAQRCAQLAFECSAPGLSEALMRLAADYLAQSHRQSATEQPQLQADPRGFGD
jgi:hypothetical protein